MDIEIDCKPLLYLDFYLINIPLQFRGGHLLSGVTTTAGYLTVARYVADHIGVATPLHLGSNISQINWQYTIENSQRLKL